MMHDMPAEDLYRSAIFISAPEEYKIGGATNGTAGGLSQMSSFQTNVDADRR